MTIRRLIGMALLMAVLWVTGCGDRATNPVGSELVGGSDNLFKFEVPADSLATASSVFEGVVPLIQGETDALLAGQMNGLIFRSLLRFRVPSADSLARAAGRNSADGLEVNFLRLHLQGTPALQLGGGRLAVSRPEGAWDESSVFVDSLTFEETQLDASPIAGIPEAFEVSHTDSSVVIDLKSPAMEGAIVTDSLMAQIDLMLHPTGTEEFLAVWASSEGTLSERPRLELTYSFRGDSLRSYRSDAVEDTYWGAREGGGPPSDLLIMASGIRYSSLLRFNLPKNIPPGATVNSVRFEADVDLERSFLIFFRFQVSRLQTQSGVQDTLMFNTWAFEAEAGQQSFVLNRALVQGWVSGEISNDGMLLSPVDNDQIFWVVFEDPRLTVTYSLPPDVGRGQEVQKKEE